jgi:hypothetical protein
MNSINSDSNSDNQMVCREFFNMLNINWEPIDIEQKKMKDGKIKKTPLKVGNSTYGYFPKNTDFTTNLLTDEEFLKRQKFYQAVDYVTHDTSKIQIIDIDDIELTKEAIDTLISNSPYYLSVSKNLPHIFAIIEDPENCPLAKYIMLDNPKIDILNSQWAWCGSDQIIYNANNSIRTINSSLFKKKKEKNVPIKLENVKMIENEKKGEKKIQLKKGDFEVPVEILAEIINGFPNEFSDPYDTWTKIVWGIYNISSENKYLKKYGNKLIHDFSKKSLKYDSESVDDFISKCKYDDIGIHYGTLIQMLKEENVELYMSICKKMNVINNSYLKVKERFEINKFKVMYPLAFCVIKENEDLEMCKRATFKESFENLYYYHETRSIETGKISIKRKQFVKDWLLDEDIRTYDKIDFLPPPLECNENTYNLWSGFAIEKKIDYIDNIDYENDEHIIKFKNHLLILHNNNIEHTKRGIDWVAHKIQYPAIKIESALVYKGEEGSGKNTFTDIIKNIFGSKLYFESGNAADEIFSKFSVAGKHKLINVINESSGKDNTKHWEKIKHMITTHNQWYEIKGVTMFEMKDLRDFVFLTNNDFCLPINNRQRRFFPIETSEELKGNCEYFKDFYTTIVENDYALRKIYQYLLQLEITSNFREIPETELGNDIIENNLDYESKFIRSFAYDQYDKNNITFIMTNLEFFTEFQKFLEKYHITLQGYNALKFGTRISRKKITGITRPIDGRKDKYYININEIFTWLLHKQIIKKEDIPIKKGTNLIHNQNPEITIS